LLIGASILAAHKVAHCGGPAHAFSANVYAIFGRITVNRVEWITTVSVAIAALAAVVNAITVIILARTTDRCAKSTADILLEFDDLRLARSEIDRLKNASQSIRSGFYDATPSKASTFLTEAFVKFREAQSYFLVTR
jgi:hypothetical protein